MLRKSDAAKLRVTLNDDSMFLSDLNSIVVYSFLIVS